MKIQKQIGGGGRVGGGVGFGVGDQGGCELRSEVILKIQKKSGWGWGGVGGREDPVVGGQGGCERRIEVIVKMQKKSWGVRSGRGWGWVEGVGVAILGVGSDVGYGGGEPKIEGIVQCTKIKIKKKCVWGGGSIFEPKTLSIFEHKTLSIYNEFHCQRNFIF